MLLFLQQADLDHAIEQFRSGLAVDPANPQLHYDLDLPTNLAMISMPQFPSLNKRQNSILLRRIRPTRSASSTCNSLNFPKPMQSLSAPPILQPLHGGRMGDAGQCLASRTISRRRPSLLSGGPSNSMPDQPSPHITSRLHSRSARGHSGSRIRAENCGRPESCSC